MDNENYIKKCMPYESNRGNLNNFAKIAIEIVEIYGGASK